MKGSFPLYEQAYEKDKVQIYHLTPKYKGTLSMKDNHKSVGKQMTRFPGRISGCGPFKSEWSYCYEDGFDQEFKALLEKL